MRSRHAVSLTFFLSTYKPLDSTHVNNNLCYTLIKVMCLQERGQRVKRSLHQRYLATERLHAVLTHFHTRFLNVNRCIS